MIQAREVRVVPCVHYRLCVPAGTRLEKPWRMGNHYLYLSNKTLPQGQKARSCSVGRPSPHSSTRARPPHAGSPS